MEELLYEEQGVRVVGQLPCCNGLEVSQQLGRFWMKGMELRVPGKKDR